MPAFSAFRILPVALAASAPSLPGNAAAADQPEAPALPPVIRQADMVYPDHSRRLDEEGDTVIAFEIDSAGKPTRCTIARSSGFERLDAASCAGAMTMRFASQDGAAAPALGPFRMRIRWQYEDEIPDPVEAADGSTRQVALPDATRGVNWTRPGELRAGQRANLGLYLDVSADGAVAGCEVRWGSGNPVLDARACERARGWRYQPATRGGVAVAHVQLETFLFADIEAPVPPVQ